MDEQQDQSEESSENEVNQEDHPILVAAVNAGASLKAPAKAAISRKRKLPVNEGKYKQRGSKTTVNTVSEKTTAWDRLKDFPNHHFAVVDRRLRCNACSELISLKKSSITKHVASVKHKKGLSDIAKSKSESQTIMEFLQRRDKKENAAGTCLPAEMQLFAL